jgi:hypothetical protein
VRHSGLIAGWRTRLNLLRRHDRLRKVCRSLQETLSLRSRSYSDDWFEQLPHHAETKVALEYRAVAHDHPHPALGGALASRVKKRGLANAGRTLNHHHCSVACERSADRDVDRQELLATFQQPRGGPPSAVKVHPAKHTPREAGEYRPPRLPPRLDAHPQIGYVSAVARRHTLPLAECTRILMRLRSPFDLPP